MGTKHIKEKDIKQQQKMIIQPLFLHDTHRLTKTERGLLASFTSVLEITS